MKSRRQIDNRRLEKVGIVFAEIELAELIRQAQTTIIRHVEEVGDEADARAFVDHPRIVNVQIQLGIERRTAKLTTTADRNLTRIQVNRMWQKFADRYARLHAEAHTHVQTVQETATKAGSIATEAVAGVNVRDKAPIGIQLTN